LLRLYRAKDYIHANVEHELPLGEIARAAALAPHHFLRTFRANFGVTPHAYLVQQRLARARLLLAGTDLSVHSICTRIGFSNAHSFSNLFRRHHGLSPRAYRQRHAK
jgi:AraC family transcriptional regulator